MVIGQGGKSINEEHKEISAKGMTYKGTVFMVILQKHNLDSFEEKGLNLDYFLIIVLSQLATQSHPSYFPHYYIPLADQRLDEHKVHQRAPSEAVSNVIILAILLILGRGGYEDSVDSL